MDLFEYMRENTMEKESPLASRMRPTTLDEVVGQKHIIGKDKFDANFMEYKPTIVIPLAGIGGIYGVAILSPKVLGGKYTSCFFDALTCILCASRRRCTDLAAGQTFRVY